MDFKDYVGILWLIRFSYKTFMIIWILIDLYHKDLNDLKGIYRFIRFVSVKLREIGMKTMSSPLENSHLNNMIQLISSLEICYKILYMITYN